MVKKLLKNKKGESLVETLAAILIFTIASIALYSMVTTAAGINMRVRENDVRIQSELKVAEEAEPTSAFGMGKVDMVLTVDKNGRPSTHAVYHTDKIQVYRKDDNCLYSYKLVP